MLTDLLGNLADMAFVSVDLETTGFDPVRDRVVEVGAVRYIEGHVVETYQSLVNPGVYIGPETSKVHHVTNALVQGAPDWQEAQKDLTAFVGDMPVVGHNVAFDIGFARSLAQNDYLCTWRLARHLWDAPEYNLQYLRYWLDLDIGTGRFIPHAALDDAVVAGALFVREVREFEMSRAQPCFEDLLRFERAPISIKRFPNRGPFGGRPLDEIPTPYLKAALEDSYRPLEYQELRLDGDTLDGVRQELAARATSPSRTLTQCGPL